MRLKPWLLAAAAVIVLAAVLFGINSYRHRFVRQNSDLARLLPPGDYTIIYADISLLRHARLLGILANIKAAPDQQYNDFIQATGFDYTRDLDAIVIATDPDQDFLIGRGRFSWQKLVAFARSHQGTCEADSCRIPATTPGRWVNFLTIQPDVLAVAVSVNPTAADNLRPPARRLQQPELAAFPIWATPSKRLLYSSAAVPLPLRIFAIDLQSAESVILSAEPAAVHLKAHFPTGAAADTARRQLEIGVKTLSTALSRDNQPPDPATLAGLLIAGSFQVIGTDVQGLWPIRPELLKALQ